MLSSCLRTTSYFNPRPPCGGRQEPRKPLLRLSLISIHVPRVEDDQGNQLFRARRCSFQSTSPVWRTTHTTTNRALAERISIHVPRVEDDEIIAEKSTS